MGVGTELNYSLRPVIDVEFKDTRNQDDRLRPIAVFTHCEAERCCTIEEDSTADAMLVLNDPVPTAVLAN
jgi:hypothetical protein